eukprot:11208583-Lingulodinium_polyedra.AAC.1
MIVAIENPKNKRCMGRQQFVVCRDVRLIGWWEWLRVGLGPDARLLEGGRSALVSLFQPALVELHLANVGITL